MRLNEITFAEIGLGENQELAEWLSGDTWDNFTNPFIPYDSAMKWIEQGVFHGNDKKSFWTISSGERVGLLQLKDLLDNTAMFDIRINTKYRRCGVGRHALRWLTKYTFENYPDIVRIEANTRADNVGMRRVLRACGYVKEAHYRDAWHTAEEPGVLMDGVAYSVLRRDWLNNTITPVHWDDESSPQSSD